MQTVMYTETIFGPIHSRRLGTSLGVNLNPRDGKVCSFDCLYCEAGYNAQGPGTSGMPSRAEVRSLLEDKLRAMTEAAQTLDTITFSGNGEPTLHPDFPGVIDDTLALRDRFFPGAKVSVLSNATMLHRAETVDALRRVDNPILKLDSALEATVRIVDRPVSPTYSVAKVIDRLADFGPHAIVQTMITCGEHDGVSFDQTDPAEISALIEAYKKIRPQSIMLYTIDRPTPEKSLRRVPRETLDGIAARITAETGIRVSVAG